MGDFTVHCGDCLHEWRPCELPADVRVVVKASKKPCPICGASTKRIFCAPAPKTRMEAAPSISEAQAIRIVLQPDAMNRVTALWPAEGLFELRALWAHISLALMWQADLVNHYINSIRAKCRGPAGEDVTQEIFDRDFAPVLPLVLQEPAKRAWAGSNLRDDLARITVHACLQPGGLAEIRDQLFPGVRWNG